MDSVTFDRDPSSDYELSIKKYVDDSVGEGTIVKFHQTLENYLKVAVGNDTYNLNKYDKKQSTYKTIFKQGNGHYLLLRWKIICNDKSINGVTTNFIRATKTNSPTSQSRLKANLRSVIVLFIKRRHLIVMLKTYLSAGNELILYKLII